MTTDKLLEELLQKYRNARQGFWDTHDRLITELGLSLQEMRENDEYIEAEENVSNACEAYVQAQKRITTETRQE